MAPLALWQTSFACGFLSLILTETFSTTPAIGGTGQAASNAENIDSSKKMRPPPPIKQTIITQALEKINKQTELFKKL